MSNKVSYASLKLKTNTDVNTFDFNEKQIEVIQYLPIEDKYQLLMETILSSEPDGYFNDILLDINFHLNLVFHYSNLTFTEKQKEDMAKIFDTLVSSGFMEEFLKAMNEDEYNQMLEYLNAVKGSKDAYDHCASSAIVEFAESIPKGMEQANSIINNFDSGNFTQLQELADATGYNNKIKALV